VGEKKSFAFPFLLIKTAKKPILSNKNKKREIISITMEIMLNVFSLSDLMKLLISISNDQKVS